MCSVSAGHTRLDVMSHVRSCVIRACPVGTSHVASAGHVTWLVPPGHDWSISDMTHFYVTWPTCMTARLGTGRRRCIGCLKLQVSFCKRATNCRAVLRKLTYKDKAFYDAKPPSRGALLTCDSYLKFTYDSHMNEDSQMNEDSHTNEDSHMGWLRVVGSLKLQVSFAKKPYKRDYILQKRPIILRRLLLEATPLSVSHITHERVLLHIQKSCHIWISHVIYIGAQGTAGSWRSCVVSLMNNAYISPTYASHRIESCHIWMSHVPYESLMSHV